MWHTYPPVEMPSAEAVIAALTRPETWPDYASEIGRFTPLRPGGLDGQTFAIEVAAGTESGRPIFRCGCYGKAEPRVVPEGATPLVGFDPTTHRGHFMGSGRNRLVLYTHGGRAWVRAAGTWDPMPWHLDRAYRLAGSEAQHAFWGQGGVERLSMLHQLARRIAA